ncbi:MAG: hypothetical protein ACF8TS_22930 [Maioricimonas sp. JB049]
MAEGTATGRWEALRIHVRDFLVERITQTEPDRKPFPHFVVSGLFPVDVYEQMLDWLPDPALYAPVDEYKYANTGGDSVRDKLGMSDEGLSRLPEEQREFWTAIRNALSDPLVKRAVFRQLSEGLIHRYGVSKNAVADLPGFPKPELYREVSGYQIKPHPDTRKKVVTMQIALPRDESQVQLGTAFYRLSVKPSALLGSFRGFEKVKQVQFLPNSAYAFCVLNTVTKRSWHGRDMLPDGAGVRNSLLHLYYEDAAKANPDVVAKYYPNAALQTRAA